MIALTIGEIAVIVDGRLAGNASPEAIVTAPAAYDSRRIVPGGIFLAFAGEKSDGHAFAAAAFAAGAVVVIGTLPIDGPCIVVGDVLVAVAALAAAVVRRLPELTVVGVTGSSGKTSTKDLLGAVLSRLGPTVAPPGSSNNELGHPVTVLLADEQTRYLVVELGARGLGHISYLAAIAPPRIGVVLNVGSAHLGEFGSVAAIAQAKGELVEALPSAEQGGVAILNGDDPTVAAMASRTSARIVRVGENSAADVRGENITLDDLGRASFTMVAAGEAVRVSLMLSGEHQVGNALAAAAVALECGLAPAEVAAALSQAAAASRWRMEIHERPDGVVVINDAYNANPESMRAALKTLAIMSRGRRSWAVLGPMAELGDRATQEHDALGRLAVRLDINTLIAVGEQARPISQGASHEGSYDGESVWVPDIDAALAMLHSEVRAGDVILVKASRSAGLERLAQALADDRLTDKDPKVHDEEVSS
ncbi:MAG: murF [Pseudonocardiales bacterium]|nr:murF [Pseudonocardiales bacterium]